MIALLKSERVKLKHQHLLTILLVGPLLSLFIGLINPMVKHMNEFNPWLVTLMFVNLPYALLFLPLATGILAGIICRYEHLAGGWKQLVALPVKRYQIYLSKFLMIVLLVLVMQLVYGVVIFITGVINQFNEPFPFEQILSFILLGWLATFPMIALQLFASMHWRSFAVSFTMNIFFTIPSILAINSERFGPFYPWAQPFFMMYPSENSLGFSLISIQQMILVTGVSFLVFFLMGIISFHRKNI